ncbi:MAG: serine--tRNA ligase, partial [Candidatus Acidiferrales bacterium]
MIDLNYFREHLDEIERMLQDRNARLDLDAFRKLDAERRQRITSVERLKAERNTGSEEVG